MTRRAWGMAWTLAVVLLATVAWGQTGPTVSDAWVAEPAAGATSAEVYAVVENPSMYEVFVVSVATDAAGAAEIVEGPADTAKTVKELSVPAYGRAELKPGAVRIRLKDLRKPLKAGDTVALTITTDSGAVIKVSGEVRKR